MAPPLKGAGVATGLRKKITNMSQNPDSPAVETSNQPAVVVSQGYPLEAIDSEGNVFLIVAWVRNPGPDEETGGQFSPLVVPSGPDEDFPDMFITPAIPLAFGSAHYRIAKLPTA